MDRRDFLKGIGLAILCPTLTSSVVWVDSPVIVMRGPLFMDPDTFQFKQNVRTRYAKTTVNPDYYGRILITGKEVWAEPSIA